MRESEGCHIVLFRSGICAVFVTCQLHLGMILSESKLQLHVAGHFYFFNMWLFALCDKWNGGWEGEDQKHTVFGLSAN